MDKSPQKRIKRVTIALLVVFIIFYSFVFWKMSNTSNQYLTFGKKIKIMLTWNPAEIFFRINNSWNSQELKEKEVEPSKVFTNAALKIEDNLYNKKTIIGQI